MYSGTIILTKVLYGCSMCVLMIHKEHNFFLSTSKQFHTYFLNVYIVTLILIRS